MFSKLFAVLLLGAGIIQAKIVPANIDKKGIDEENVISDPHYPYIPLLNIVVVDSGSEYSMWTQQHECLAYNPVIGGLQFVCRSYNISGKLDVWQSDSIFSIFVLDQQIGGGRYPHSIASHPGPHISFPYLIAGAWGSMAAQYERGGWYSSQWDTVVDVGGGNVHTFKCIGKQLPDGNICFIGLTGDNSIIFRTWNYDLSQQLASGVVAPATSYYWGFDVNGGIAYIFWYDDNLNVYYKTTTDGISWSQTQIYNLVWPQPFTNNVFYWGQMALTDGGNPILVFDIVNGDDTEYPYEGKIYVSIAPGQPCIEVGVSTQGAENFYPTIATGGNYVVVLFGKTRNGSGPYTFWDIYYNYSADNGLTWHTPINLTTNITDHNNCLWQIAKRVVPAGYGQFFFVFGAGINDPMLDLYWDIINGGVNSARWYVARNKILGVEEKKNRALPFLNDFKVISNPAHNEFFIFFVMQQEGIVGIDLYDAIGRKVRTLTKRKLVPGCHKLKIVLNPERQIAKGVYFIKIKTDFVEKALKFIIE
ncbi:MAG: T9SS type A sorting domain-containing protein [candidate division WOR-3 bacterium]